MELIGSLVLFVALAIVSYSYAKRKRLEHESGVSNNGTGTSKGNAQLSVLQEELERRTKVINRVDVFIKGSKLIEPIAVWRDEKIYKYIFNNGYLYEFEDILAENNQRIGIDEEHLCFRQLAYKRVNNPTEFMIKFGSTII